MLLQPQLQIATDEPADVDLANLAIIVDELEGTSNTTLGRSTPRDYVQLVVACFFRLIGFSFTNYPHSHRLLLLLCGVELWRVHNPDSEGGEA
jgi:hypothetical protein